MALHGVSFACPFRRGAERFPQRRNFQRRRIVMASKTIVAHMKSQLETLRRQLGAAAVDFSFPDDKLLELREEARRMAQEAEKLQSKSSKGFFGFLGF
jgi:hypothetical protein